MTALAMDVRELSVAETDNVSGAVPVYAARIALGAAIGAGQAAMREYQGDGLSWGDWDEVAVGAGWGALAGAGAGFIKKRNW